MIRNGKSFDVDDFEEESIKYQEQLQNELELDNYDVQYKGFTDFTSISQ